MHVVAKKTFLFRMACAGLTNETEVLPIFVRFTPRTASLDRDLSRLLNFLREQSPLSFGTIKETLKRAEERDLLMSSDGQSGDGAMYVSVLWDTLEEDCEIVETLYKKFQYRTVATLKLLYSFDRIALVTKL